MAMEPSAYRRTLFATGLAAGMLLASGVAYRAVANHYARPSDSIPIPKGTLAQLPMQIGSWTGEDVPMSERMVRATDTDDHINRRYFRSGRSDTVSLYVAYGVRFRDLMPHRPEVCYPSAGWTLNPTQTKNTEIQLDDGARLTCRILNFSRTGLRNEENLSVLNYYILDGNYSKDVSMLRSRSWKSPSAGSYVAQIQITWIPCAIEELADEPARVFTANVTPMIRTILETAVRKANAPAQAGKD